ncbi:MAG: hypothetical protein Q8O47_05065, partial [Candidatus Bathyarchaeota archaeon]|nr:hypothetical protein [Candidatus Bathyarchaeota archaeon]
TVSKAGAVVKTFTGTAAADGTYTATLDTKDIAPGSYDMAVKLVVKAGPVGLGSLDEYTLTVSEKPVDYTLYAAILAAIVVVVAAGYIVLRRRKK